MTERNPYSQQFNYDTYDRPGQRGVASDPTLRERIFARVTSPVFATVALLCTAAAFAGIIAISYPGDAPEADVPVIQASAGDIRAEAPANGGVDVPYQDSTVFSSIQASDLEEKAPVEDLLAEEKPIDKLEAFAKEAENMFDETPSSPSEITEDVASSVPMPTAAANDNPAPDTGAPAKTADAAAATADTGQIKQPAGTAPETVAFMKSALEKEPVAEATPPAPTQAVNTKADVAEPAPQKIEPAAGAATSAPRAIKKGSYFVQLGSVRSESGASAEWKSLQKKFGVLQGAQYRVQSAKLADGMRYRIQAGPMERDMASNICATIKVQKPGGCIVVQ